MLTPYFLSSSVRLPRVVSSIEGFIFGRLGELSSNIFFMFEIKINIGLYLSYSNSFLRLETDLYLKYYLLICIKCL